MAWLRAFLKCKFDHLLDIFLANIFAINWILQKEFYFCKFAKKNCRFYMMYHLSYHVCILVLKYPSRDRVKLFEH